MLWRPLSPQCPSTPERVTGRRVITQFFNRLLQNVVTAVEPSAPVNPYKSHRSSCDRGRRCQTADKSILKCPYHLHASKRVAGVEWGWARMLIQRLQYGSFLWFLFLVHLNVSCFFDAIAAPAVTPRLCQDNGRHLAPPPPPPPHRPGKITIALISLHKCETVKACHLFPPTAARGRGDDVTVPRTERNGNIQEFRLDNWSVEKLNWITNEMFGPWLFNRVEFFPVFIFFLYAKCDCYGRPLLSCSHWNIQFNQIVE